MIFNDIYFLAILRINRRIELYMLLGLLSTWFAQANFESLSENKGLSDKIQLSWMRGLKKYLTNIFNSHQHSDNVRREAYAQITLSLNKAFALPSLNQYSKSLSLKGLLVKAVEMFVGSRAMPRNITLSKHLMSIAQAKANSPREKDEIQYYKYFFVRMEAFKTGNTSEFNFSSEMINRLAEERNHPQSCYLVGKQIYNLIQSTTNLEDKKNMAKLAAHYFELSLNDNQYGGLYYLGDILRNTEYTDMSEEQIREFFILGAAMGDPMSYFRMAHIYLSQSKTSLYLKYLKMAAESGVMEAQHNLGCEYLQGKMIKKDEVKALSWFLHAGANGFIESKYNLVYMFLTGSSCGRVKVNKKAALLYLQQLLKLGEPVEDKIKQLVASQQQQDKKLYKDNQ